ncbi:MAG TPA: MBL fold metallo-hydrolase [Terriglobales bacterium]|jgi:phosphoribosyl 1,2-cyclic phosphate phosphodiesterase|nr:MBL fold metallo-hydrolase [Terriglobales bacterium]
MKALLTVLGSGTSMGVPTIGCDCRVCTSPDPHDRRTRPSVLLEFADRHVLIDTTPDFRWQAIRAGIRKLDAVLYTHGHADHILGLDDLRPLSFRHPGRLPLYASAEAARTLRRIFAYVFDEQNAYPSKAQVDLHHFNGEFQLFGVDFRPVEVMHGDEPIHGFRFGSAAYLTDFSDIPAASRQQLRGLDVLFLDALRHTPHPTHSTVENSLKLVEELAPKRAFFTHISHDLPHAETNASLPPHVRLAHDGLRLEFEI